MASKDSHGSARKGRPVGTTKTQRIRRLACADCGYTAYTSRKWLAVGLPTCACGKGPLMPDSLEDLGYCVDAGTLTATDVETHPTWVEYQRAVGSAIHGQAGPARAMRNVGNELRSPMEVAADRIERARRKEARDRQLSGLRRGNVDPSTAPADDEIPF